MLGVDDSVADYTLKEGLNNTTGLVIDYSRNTLNTTTASKTTDRGIYNALNSVPRTLTVTYSTGFPKAVTAGPTLIPTKRSFIF